MWFPAVCIILSGFVTPVRSASGAEDIPDSVCFQGSVLHGEDYARNLPGGLVFRLIGMVGNPHGWTISIAPSDSSDENYCAVVTPPYRGINALRIYSWNLLEWEETDSAEELLNLPGKERSFRFVTGNDDYELARDCLEGMLWPDNQEDFERSAEIHESIPVWLGVLNITDTGALRRSGEPTAQE